MRNRSAQQRLRQLLEVLEGRCFAPSKIDCVGWSSFVFINPHFPSHNSGIERQPQTAHSERPLESANG